MDQYNTPKTTEDSKLEGRLVADVSLHKRRKLIKNKIKKHGKTKTGKNVK